MLAKVDILLKKHSLGTEEDYIAPIAIAKEAYELSKRIFGEKAFQSNQALLLYAMTLTKIPAKEAESAKLFTKAEQQFEQIASQVQPSKNSNILFNIILHYGLMLNDFCTTVDSQKRLELLQKLKSASKVNNSNKLTKKSLVCIQEIFITEDPATLLTSF